ncbi:MAG: ATP-dependent helicase, partial [Verrucomicrobiae bacterium]|nr:ATP-dependent helicase [Verrucomicrobiae bacterium]
MNVDRATLDFLNSFSTDEKQEGQRLHKEGAVTQIFGNHLLIQGRVEDADWACRTRIQLQGNEWFGEADDKSDSGRAALYATMLEKVARKGELPEAPNEVGEKSLTEVIEDKLGRGLTGEEDEYLGKMERRFRRFELEREIFDSDLVRLNPRWPVESFEPLILWPSPPRDIVEFWNYIAHAFEKANYPVPSFLEVITDREWTRERMASWEKRREESEWRYQVEVFEKRPVDDAVETVEFRLRISTREARLMVRTGENGAFERVADEEHFSRLEERYANGGLRMSAGSEILWSKFIHAAAKEESTDGGLSLDRLDNCRLLNRLFHQRELEGLIVNLDEHPFRLSREPLRWVCRPDSVDASDDYEMQLVTASGEEISHTLRLLPGDEALYMSDEWVFTGPEHWARGETLIDPRVVIPSSVIESESGVAFLFRLGAKLPAPLEKKIREESLRIIFNLGISSGATAASSEHMLMKISAVNSDESREEVLGREGWEVVKQPKGDAEHIFRYDRGLQRRAGRLIAPMQPTFDGNLGCYRARVTKNFPEKYAEWLDSLPEEIEIIADADLATLQADPVEAQVSFEVVDQEIDWFDLKVVVKVEGMDLTQDEIRALVQARGQFVRMERGGWLRLKMNLSEDQQEAVSRIGLDPFDLSGEVHRLHALQLAEPAAKEVFDANAWERISTRARSLKLQVRPDVPAGLNVNLRPYQIEGFHFLAYLTTNRFGGILADDMGLG